jgi:uncharacterized OB-fold protein
VKGVAEQKLPTIRSRALTYIHDIPVARIKRFWDGLIEGKVYATKCKRCGELYYPPQVDCFKCLTSDVEWIALSDEGVIETFTESHLKPQGFIHYEKPYIISIVKTPEGAKVMGWLEGIDVDKVRVGLNVKITTILQSDGYPAIVFKPKQH